MSGPADAPAFLAGLDPEARTLLLSVARAVTFVPTATIVRHGDPARGAWLVEAGTVEASVTLPGGERLIVATLGPGSVLGEMALIETGTCTATVRAVSPVTAWFVAHEDFRALVSQAQAPALRLHHALTAALATKVAALNERMLGCAAPEDRPARRSQPDPLAGIPRSRTPDFELSPFLARLPIFERFAPGEIEEVVGRGAYVKVARGAGVFTAGAPAEAAYIVVHGAVEVVSPRGELERRLGIVGPGQLVGYLSVLRRSAHTASAFAREASLLLEISSHDFHEAYFGASRASARLRHAVQANLLSTMARTNRALTRLISLERLASARAEATALEAAYHSQLATASPL